MPIGFERLDDVVTIDIWLNSEFFQQKGHIVLRTYRGGLNNKGIHASFWPHGRNDSKYMGPEFTVSYYPGGCFRTANYDLLKVNRGQPPDYKIHLRGFDIDKINDEFTRILNEKVVFSIYGSVYPVNATLKTANCTQIVHRLLRAGGLVSEINRAIYYAIGAGLSSLCAFRVGIDFADHPYLTRLKVLSMLLWILGLLISRKSHYKGSVLLPIIANLIGMSMTHYGRGLIKEIPNMTKNPNTRRLLLGSAEEKLPKFIGTILMAIFILVFGIVIAFGSIPVMFSICYFPINFPAVSIVKTPEVLFRLLSNSPGAQIKKKNESFSNSSFFKKMIHFGGRNKWPLGVAAGMTSAVTASIVLPKLKKK